MFISGKNYPAHPKGKESPLVLQSGETPEIVVIWLHGLGDTSENFSYFCKNIPIYKTRSVRFIVPQAPICPVSYRSNMCMPSWYNVSSIEIDDIERQIDLKDVEETKKYVLSLIQSELDSGIPAHTIFLGGFSQGGAISLETAFYLPQKIGGIICLSGYLPYSESREIKDLGQINTRSPIFFAYGPEESLLPVKSFTRTSEVLCQCGFDVSVHTYDMDHEICQQEILDINDFLITKSNQ